MYLKTFIITTLILFSDVAYANPALITNAIQIYVQYKKACPNGLVNVEQKIPAASPSIGYNRKMREEAAKNKENTTETEYCLPVVSKN